MLKVKKENLETLLDYGFEENSGVYSYKVDDYFTLLVNMYINGKGLIDDGLIRIGYTNEDVCIDSDMDIIDVSAELPNVIYDLITAGIVYVS